MLVPENPVKQELKLSDLMILIAHLIYNL